MEDDLPDLDIERDDKTTRNFNMNVLRRHDPFILDVLITAPHVIMYEYDLKYCQWSRKDVEGSFFIVKRSISPRFQFIVMNRRNTENMVEDILGNLEFEVKMPYLMYRNKNGEVYGIWFYSHQCCQAVMDLFNRILCAYKNACPKRSLPPNRSEFEELEAVPTADTINQPLQPEQVATSLRPSHSPLQTFFDKPCNERTNVEKDKRNDELNCFTAQEQRTFFDTRCGDTQAPQERSEQTTPKSQKSVLSFYQSNPEKVTRPNNFAERPCDLLQFFASSNRSSPSRTLSPPVGEPLLQPFPPPMPPHSLSQNLNLNSNLNSKKEMIVNRERVRDALTDLMQNDGFVEMVYQAILKAHNGY